MKNFVASLACLVALGLASSAFATAWPPEVIKQVTELRALATDKKDQPATLAGVKNITGAELKQWMDTKKPFVLSDNRVKEQFDVERIKGAKWLLADHLLADPKLAEQSFKKDDTIVLYCNGISCWRSPAAAVMLQHLGYKNLYWYRVGLPEWKGLKFPME